MHAVEHPSDTLDSFVASMPDDYLRAFQPGDLAEHYAIAVSRVGRETRAEAWRRIDARTCIVCVVAEDVPGLVARVATTFTQHRLGIQSAHVFTRTAANGRREAVDFFWVEAPVADEGRFSPDLEDCLAILEGRTTPGSAPRSTARPARSGAPADAKPRVSVVAGASRHYLVVVEAPDAPGLLQRLTETLVSHALEIASAHVTTDGSGAIIDRFVVRHLSGRELKGAEVEEVRRSLIDQLVG